jgi:hypothetical protein
VHEPLRAETGDGASADVRKKIEELRILGMQDDVDVTPW